MKIGAIILARLDSSRLPGKALIKINDRELILRVVDVCSRLNGIKEVIVATTTRDVDTPLAEFIEKNGINCFRGDYQNVAKRFLDVMSQKELDAAIRLNGDSPFQRPFLINQAINIFLKGGYDLVTNVPGRRYPHGMSVEIISKKSMEFVNKIIEDDEDKEHVTKYFYNNTKKFKIKLIDRINLAIDNKDDLLLANKIIKHFGINIMDASIEDIVKIALLHKNKVMQC